MQSSSNSKILIEANAKINIGLFVTSRRSDGYHDIETIFYPLCLHDDIEVERMENSGIELIEEGLKIDCPTADNLIVKSYKLLHDRHGIGGVRIRLRKTIPFGAGLGGGSSDAAHVVVALNELFHIGLSKEQMAQIVSALGADCSFFVHNTPCFASGIGDQLSSVALSLRGYTIVLIKPDIAVPTKQAYSGITPHAALCDLRQIDSLPITQWQDKVRNDFEPTVFRLHPTIGQIKQWLIDKGAIYASMSGSGSAVFGIFEDNGCPTAEELEKEFADCFVHTEKCKY